MVGDDSCCCRPDFAFPEERGFLATAGGDEADGGPVEVTVMTGVVTVIVFGATSVAEAVTS